MGLFNFFKKKGIVEEVAPVADEVVLDEAPEDFDAEIARLHEIIQEYERAHEDDQVIINVMSKELTAIKKTLEESRDSYVETYEENGRLKRFYNYFDNLRFRGLEVKNFNRLKPMDDYIDAAKEEMENVPS